MTNRPILMAPTELTQLMHEWIFPMHVMPGEGVIVKGLPITQNLVTFKVEKEFKNARELYRFLGVKRVKKITPPK